MLGAVKSFLATIVVVALLVAGAWVLLSSQLSSPPPVRPVTPVELVPAAASAGATAMTVQHVHDGDTLFLVAADGSELKVRLLGIDTPELRPAPECFSVEARDHLRALVPDGSVVTVSPDTEALDQYGRSLYYLWSAQGEFVNLRLVSDGYGTALNIEPNTAYANEFAAAEATARESGAGLWAAC